MYSVGLGRDLYVLGGVNIHDIQENTCFGGCFLVWKGRMCLFACSFLCFQHVHCPSSRSRIWFQIGDEALQHIGENCPDLETLNVQGCKVSGPPAGGGGIFKGSPIWRKKILREGGYYPRG